jgi:hypothetical protein
MTLADDYLAEVGCADIDRWHRDGAARLLERLGASQPDPRSEAMREARLLSAAAVPVVWIAIDFGVSGMPGVDLAMPGVDLARDADLAAGAALHRRWVLAHKTAGLNGRLAERNLRLLDRVCALIGSWPDPDWSEAVRRRVDELAAAMRRGRERGERLRATGQMADPPPVESVGWLLRNPGDHWFRFARVNVSDPTLCALIDAWITDFAPSYTTLASEDWEAEEARADLVVDLEVPAEIPRGWEEPIRAIVAAKLRGSVEIGSELPLRLIPDDNQCFNGTLISVLPGERWRTCARLLDDGSILPEDGTRRLKAST